MNCPVCFGNTFRKFQKYDFWILQCNECHHQFAELRPEAKYHLEQVYGDDYFEGGGAGYPDYLIEKEIIIAHGARYGKLLQRFMQPGTFLDVGAASGFIMQGLQSANWQGEGIEPNSKMAKYATEEGGQLVHVGSLENFRSQKKFDLVTMIQVISHFHNLREAMCSASKLTEDNGYWLIETWNKNSFPARVAGRNWHEYSPPSVLHWFSPNGIKILGEQFGFRFVAQGRPAKWLNGEHAKALTRYKLGNGLLGKFFKAASIIVPDRLPIPYPAFDLFWILLQKK